MSLLLLWFPLSINLSTVPVLRLDMKLPLPHLFWSHPFYCYHDVGTLLMPICLTCTLPCVILTYYLRISLFLTPNKGLTIVFLNAHGLNHLAKQRSMWKEALTHIADVIAIQETHFWKDVIPLVIINFSYIFSSTASVRKRGVLVVIRETVSLTLHDSILDLEGRVWWGVSMF